MATNSVQNVPRVGQPVAEVRKGVNGLVAECNFWLQQTLLFLGRNPSATITAPAVGASPFLFTNNTEFDLTAVVTGGTVTAVDFTRDGTSFLTVAAASPASVTLNPGDAVRITWAVLPTLNLIPR